ncbi:MAG: flagellar basal-body MS-ring/collar protein FliF [Alsobacter sp.]
MQGLVDFLNRLGPARIAAMGAVTLALVGFFAFMIMRFSQPAMGVLFTDMPMEDSGSVVKELEARNVKYELRDEGRTVLVPKADMAKLRMDLAGKGIPTGGGVGYEIFDKGDSFSATSFVQNVNALRALEGELSRTIRTMSRVQAARVHLVIPERRLFDRDREPARASIALKVSGELDPGQVRAIRHLVASAVEGLRPEQISIVDEKGRLLADGQQGESAGAAALDEKQQSYQRRVKSQVEDLVASVVGQGRSRVQVSAEIDPNRVQQTSETFDPESRVVRSTQTRNEASATVEAKDGQVSVGNELPGANGAGGGNARDSTTKAEEVINYEISKTTRTEVVEGGRLKRLSVAVLVDGTYSKAPTGELVYQPRPQEELDRIAALVRSSVGFDAKRGDQVEIVNLRFADAPAEPDVAPPAGFLAAYAPTKDDVMRGIELLVLAVLTLVVMLVVVRPLVRTVIAPASLPTLGAARQAAMAAIAGAGASGAPALAGPGAEPVHVEDSATGRMMDIARVNGQVQAKSIERIGEMVKENTAGTVTILRQWIHETP